MFNSNGTEASAALLHLLYLAVVCRLQRNTVCIVILCALFMTKILFPTVACSQPDDPINGFVIQMSNSTVVFGCNKGFSPQVNRTANCVASGQWSSSPERISCVTVEDKG